MTDEELRVHCSHVGCINPAEFEYEWPGSGTSRQCDSHTKSAIKIGAAMGLVIVPRPLAKDKLTIHCRAMGDGLEGCPDQATHEGLHLETGNVIQLCAGHGKEWLKANRVDRLWPIRVVAEKEIPFMLPGAPPAPFPDKEFLERVLSLLEPFFGEAAIQKQLARRLRARESALKLAIDYNRPTPDDAGPAILGDLLEDAQKILDFLEPPQPESLGYLSKSGLELAEKILDEAEKRSAGDG